MYCIMKSFYDLGKINDIELYKKDFFFACLRWKNGFIDAIGATIHKANKIKQCINCKQFKAISKKSSAYWTDGEKKSKEISCNI